MRRSTRHVVIGGIAIGYGSLLSLVWAWVIQHTVVSLIWVALTAVIFAVPSLMLLVTGSRLCRVTTTVSRGLKVLIYITVTILVLKAAVAGVFGLLGAAGPGSNRGNPYGGIFQAIGWILLGLVAAPNAIVAVLLGLAAKRPAPLSSEAKDYDDELYDDPATKSNVEGGTIATPLSRRWRVGLVIAAVLAGIGMPAWYGLAYGGKPAPISLGNLVFPSLVLAVAAGMPWARRKSWYVLVVALLLMVAVGSPVTSRMLRSLSPYAYALQLFPLIRWLLAILGPLVAWIVSPIRPAESRQHIAFAGHRSKRANGRAESEPHVARAGHRSNRGYWRVGLAAAGLALAAVLVSVILILTSQSKFRPTIPVSNGSRTFGTGTMSYQPPAVAAARIYPEPPPHRGQKNLFTNRSFEDGLQPGWATRSWRMDAKAIAVVTDGEGLGQRSVRLSPAQADDCMVSQRIAVKPNTRYRLSGMVRTQNVVVTDPAGWCGANLSLWGEAEVSRSITGTTDWVYLILEFNSKNRTMVEVGAQLGTTRV